MDVREFPVLTDEDLVDRLSSGLGEDAARVLAYLLCRSEEPSLDPSATLTATHIGTGLSRSAARAGLEALEADALVAGTTAETTTPGRPPKAWRAVDSRSAAVRRTWERHARRLLRQGERFDERTAGSAGDPDGSGPGGGESAREERPDDADRDARSDDRRLSIGLNWRSNALHLPLFAARRSDVAGAEVVLEEHDGSSAAARAVASGEVDVGVAGAATVLRERARGRPVVPIATLYQRSPVVLYSTAEAFGGSFDGLERLRGRRVGTPPGAETALLAHLLLERAGLRGAVDVVDVEGEERAALRSGTVDVVTGMEPDLWRMDREVVDVLAVADHYPVYGPALIASRETLQDDRSRLETALAAATAGWAAASRSPGPAAAAVAERSSESKAAVERTFSRARERFGVTDAVRSRGWGWHSAEGWHDLRTALAQGGVLE